MVSPSLLWLASAPPTEVASAQLKRSWAVALDLLFAQAEGRGFQELLTDVFAVDSGSAASLAERLLAQELVLPEVVVLDAGAMTGAQGAYASPGARGGAAIYLNADLVVTPGQEQRLSRVLLEELGHHFDVLLNGERDTAGDEGELFASRVLGDGLTASQLLAIRSEQDTGVVLADGGEIVVEQSGLGAAPTLNGFTTFGLVDVSADLQLSFSLPIARGSQGTLKLWTKAGDLVEAFDAASSSSLSFSGSTLTINPTWDLDGSTDYYLTIDSGALQSAAGAEFTGVSSSSTLAFRSDVEISGALGSAWLRDLFPGTSSEAIGNHSALFIRATFPDVNRTPGSLEEAQLDMNDVGAFFVDNSRSRISLTTTYTPVVTLDFSHQWHTVYDASLNGLDLIQKAAREEALKLGFDSDKFNVSVVRIDKSLRSGASWGGGDSVWLAWGGSGTAAHEIGHALGLPHSNSTTWTGGSTEYGASLDNMGTGDTGPDHFIVPKKTDLGWLDSNAVLTNPGPGIYRIHAADGLNETSGTIKLFKQQIPSDNLGTNPIISLEYRPAQGGQFEDSLVLFRDGLVVKDGTGAYDPVSLYVTLGKTYQVPGSEMFLTVISKGNGYLDFAYNQGPFSGNTAPSAAFTATAANVQRFGSVTFTADAVDAEGDQLVYRWSFSDGVVGVGPTFTRSFNQSAQSDLMVTLEVSDLRGGLATLSGTLSTGAASTSGALSVGTVTTPTFSQPSVSVLATDAFTTEGGDTGTFTISRIGTATSSPLVVNLTWSGSGLADVTSLPASVTIPAGQSSVQLTISPADDAALEPIKTLTVMVSADPDYSVSAQNGAASLQLADNDATVVTVRTVDAMASEAGRDTGMFWIERTGSTAEALTVYYALSGSAYNGGDFGRLDGQVVIPVGQAYTTLAIVPLVDAAGEPEETVTLSLAAFNDTYSVGSASRGTVTIKDSSSLPSISVHGTYDDTIVSEGGTAKVVFTANGGSGAAVDVAYTITGTATSGTDFTPLTGTITLPTGGQQTVTLAIPTIADGLAENDESLTLTLSPSANYALGLDTSTQITILHPVSTASGGDRVRLSRYAASPAEAASAPADFYIYRDSTDASRQALTVTYALSGTATPGVDYTGQVRLFNGTVLATFTPEATNNVTIPATADAVIVRLIPVDDALAEGAESITLSLVSVSPSQPIAINSSATYILEDNEQSPTIVGFQTLASLWEEARNPADNIHDLVVTLNQPAPAGGVQVSYRPDGGTALGYGIDWRFVDEAGSAIQATNQVLAFAAGETSKAIRVRIINDRINESAETFSIKLEHPVNASLSGTAGRHTVTLYDIIPNGLVQEERWADQAVFTNNSWDSSPVAYSGYLDGFTSAQNVGDNYSRRLTGFITAPTSGDYTFYASGDDGVRLYVGTSDLPVSKVLVASVPSNGFTSFQQWNKYASQQSTTQTLIAGQKYYVEVQHQEGGGGDHVSIGWTGPGIPSITPITTAGPLASAENRSLRFLTDSTTLTEGQAPAEPIVVALDRASTTASISVTVEVVPSFTTANGSDYAIANATLTFAPGEVAKALDLSALVDASNESSETLSLRLVNANGARIIGPSTHTVTIVDADAPELGSITAFAARGDAAGSLLGQIVATPAAGRSVSNWEILAGNPRLEASGTPAFAIDSQGRISLVNPQALPLSSIQLQLTVRATDNLGSSMLTTAAVVVNGQRIKEERWNGQDTYTTNAWSTPAAYSADLSAFDPPRDVADNYSRRVTGAFTPQTTGDYSFWIAADEAGRLTIAPWDNPNQELEIASSGDVNYLAWDTTDSQQSEPQALVAGTRYILRAYQRESSGGDHLSVAWSGPGFARQLMPASAFLGSFSGAQVGPSTLSEATPPTVSTYSLTASAITDSGLAGSINAGEFTRDNTLGLSGTAVAGALVKVYTGDAYVASTTAAANGTWSLTTPPLGDGEHIFRAEITDGSGNVALTATRTFTVRSQLFVDHAQLISRTINSADATATAALPVGSVLAVRSPYQGLITYDVPLDQPFTEQRWSGGTPFSTNTWTEAPSYSGTLTKLTTAQNVGNNYSRRITGWITAPVTGAFTFYISGDDDAKLYVSSDATAANKGSVIASVPSGGWTDFQQWNKYSSQKSAAINLQAGQRYYVEVQHLEGGGGDHVSVGWTGPGITAITAISLPSSMLLADTQSGTVQLVTHGAADTSTAAGAPLVYGGTSGDGRYVVFGSNFGAAFGNAGTAFSDGNPIASAPYSDLFAYDRTTQALRLITAGSSAATTSSRQAEFVGISSDNRTAIYTTDYVEKIGGFSAPGKLAATTWTLVEGGYPDSAGKAKTTSLRVADIDPTKLDLQLSGGYITNDGVVASVSAVTIKRPEAGKLTFWVQANDSGTVKAVKLELTDTSNGLLVQATTAKYGQPLNSDWDSAGITGSVATSLSGAGYGVSLLQFSGTNLTTAMLDEGAAPSRDIVAVDLATGSQRLLSHSAAVGHLQSQAGDVRNATLSADGHYVLFTAADARKFGNAGTAFTDSTPAITDLFAADLQTGQIRLLSRSGASQTTSAGVAPTPLGTTTNGWAVFSSADVSAFGFTDGASSTTDLIAINLADGTLKLISRAGSGSGNSSAATALTFEKTDGKYVYFSASNATAFGFTSDADTSRADLFRYDPNSGALDLLSHASSDTTAALGGSFRAGSLTVSPNGRYAAFVLNMQASSGGFQVGITGDALFLADLQTGAIRLLNSSNSEGFNLSYGAWAGVQNFRRFFTPDSTSFVWDSSYGNSISSDRSDSASGWDGQYGVNAYIVDIAGGVVPAGTAQTTRLLSHSSISTTQAAAADVTLVGVSADSRLVYFTAADATKFGNAGIAFSDTASSATDIFAYDIVSRSISLVSGANGASYGQVASFQAAADGGAALFALGNVNGLSSVAGTLSDSNGTGLDLLAAHLNLLDLRTDDDTRESGSATDNITSKRSFVIHSIVRPGRSVQLVDGGQVVATQMAPASGLLSWSLSNVALGEHTFSLQDSSEAIPLKLASAAGQSSLKVTVIAGTLNAPTGTVTISGTATQGEVLTASNNLADLDGIPSSGSGAITYQWKANGANISGATANTYTLTQAEVGKTITVTASYIDNQGTAESVTSMATAAVLAVDNVAPESPHFALASDTGSSGADGTTNIGTVNVSAIEAQATWQYSTDGGIRWVPGSGTSFTLAAGTYATGAIRVRQTDLAGNISSSSMNEGSIIVDVTAPVAPSFALLRDTGNSSSDDTTNVGTLIISGLEANASWQYSTNGGSTWTAGAGSSFTLGEGSYAAGGVQVRQIDLAGNTSTTPSQNTETITIDLTAPTTTATIGSLNEGATGPLISNGGTSNGTAALLLTGTLSTTLAQGESVRLFDGSTFLGTGSITPGNTSWSFSDGRTLAAGQTVNYTARVADTADNLSAETTTYSITKTNALPAISISNVSVVEGAASTSTQVFFTITLSRSSTDTVTVAYQIQPGTATSGVDYTAAAESQTLTFNPGITTLTIPFVVKGDSDVEMDETLTVQLTNPNKATFSGDSTFSITTTGTIINDDSSIPPADPNQGITLTSSGNFNGTERNDVLMGDAGVNSINALTGADLITGSGGADTLTGSSGADTFAYQLRTDSTLSAIDFITDFSVSQGDKIDLQFNPAGVFNRGMISASTLEGALKLAFDDKDAVTAGNQGLQFNEIVIFQWGTSSLRRNSYVSTPDDIGINFNGDLLIKLPNNPGSVVASTFI